MATRLKNRSPLMLPNDLLRVFVVLSVSVTCTLWLALSAIAIVVKTETNQRGKTINPPLGAQFDEETGQPLNEAAIQLVLDAQGRTADPRHTNDRSDFVEPAVVESASPFLNEINSVEIVPKGTWKYILLHLSNNEDSRVVVRSYRGLEYHAHIYEQAMKQLRPWQFRGRVLGGGRITVDVKTRQITIYGYSKTFGACPDCNRRAAQLIGKSLESEKSILHGYTVSWSNKGY